MLETIRSYLIAIVACGFTWFGLTAASNYNWSKLWSEKVLEETPKSTCESISWTVPDDVKSVKVRIRNQNGTVKDTYTITNYITMKPQQQVELVPEC